MPEELRHCESPLCSVAFEPSGLKMEPKRFCCDRCKQEASLIRRVAGLLEGLTDERVIEIVRSVK